MDVDMTLESWQQMVNHMLQYNERSHIDRVMYECELALNLHGVHTRFSCSGHASMMPAYPYIIVTTHDAASFLVPEYIVLMSNNSLLEDTRTLQCDMVASMQEAGQSLLQLIDSFYRVRYSGTDYGKRLIIQSYGLSQFLLVNQGAVVGLHNHVEYLKEFIAFTTFLKDYL
jgi:hypothetical protein